MMMQGFQIAHPKTTLEIRLEDVAKLRIHEEVISEALNNLTKQIQKERCIKHPIIVDGKTLVVLDGMHRLAAARRLECRFIPVCLVDYHNPSIIVDSWCRLIQNITDFQNLERSVKGLGFNIKECSERNARELVQNREATTAILSRQKRVTVFGSRTTIKDMYDDIKRIEQALDTEGYPIEYETEQDAYAKAFAADERAMLLVPNVFKTDVIDVALKGEVFAHKTTRHIIPVRPLFVNVPLTWLDAKVNLKKANEELITYLSQKQVMRLPPGQVLDRRYDEELFVFQ